MNHPLRKSTLSWHGIQPAAILAWILVALISTPSLFAQRGEEGGNEGGSGPVFLDEESNIELLDQGEGWRKLRIADPADPDAPPIVVMAVTPSGVEKAPIPEFKRQELREDFAGEPTGGGASGDAGDAGDEAPSNRVIFVNLEFAEAIENGESLDNWPPDPNSTTENCFGWNTKTKTKTWTLDEGSFQRDFTLTQNISGTFSAQLPLQGQATLVGRYRVKEFLCAPIDWEFKDIRLHGNLSLGGDSQVGAEIMLEGHWAREWQLGNPKIGTIDFRIFGFPAWIDFHLPSFVGLDIDALLTGSVEADSDFGASGTFDYTCDKNGCTGSSSFNNSFDLDQINAALELEIAAQVYARVMLRAELYDDAVAFAEVGAQGFAQADLWGYYGNDCGDGDGDGDNETVEALVADVRAGYDWKFGIGGAFLPDRDWTVNGQRWHLGFFDLLGQGNSTALSPMIDGPTLVTRGQPATYNVKMRPCYPYSEGVNVRAQAGNFVSVLNIPSPQGSDPTTNSADVTWTFPSDRWYLARATTLQDSKGRNMQVAQELDIRSRSGVEIQAEYVATAGAAPSKRWVGTDTTPTIRFHYDESLGNFEQRPGGACHAGQNNPTYLTIKYMGPTIRGCTFRTHIDPTPIACSPWLVSVFNNRQEIVVPSDELSTDPATCQLFDPARSQCRTGQNCFVHLTFDVGGTNHPVRFNYKKR